MAACKHTNGRCLSATRQFPGSGMQHAMRERYGGEGVSRAALNSETATVEPPARCVK
jgi:hypothetical protein